MPKAMIFAAGLGTRLMPLTSHKPKALVELEGKTLLQRAIDKLAGAGVSSIVVNIHHFPELMRETLAKTETHGIPVFISDETDMLLDTGGGLLKAAAHLSGTEPVIIHNVDVISDIDLNEMVSFHLGKNALATLAVSHRKTSRYFQWAGERLCGWTNVETGARVQCFTPDEQPVNLAFSGIHIVDPSIFSMIEETGVFSINKVYLRLATQHVIVPYVHSPQWWADVGTTEKLRKAGELLQQNPSKYG